MEDMRIVEREIRKYIELHDGIGGDAIRAGLKLACLRKTLAESIMKEKEEEVRSGSDQHGDDDGGVEAAGDGYTIEPLGQYLNLLGRIMLTSFEDENGLPRIRSTRTGLIETTVPE